MQRHWVVVLLPSPSECRSSTSAKLAIMWNRGASSGSKPGGCHAKERAEPEQPVQAPEEPVGAVSSCGHVDPLEERFASWIGQQDMQPRRAWAQFHEWPQDWSRARCDEMSQWAVLVTGPPSTTKTAGVHLLARHVRGTFLECDMRELEGRKLVELIFKVQGDQVLLQTSVAIFNIDTDVTDGLKWRLCKAAQQSQIPLIFVCDGGVVTARDELVRKCLCLEVRHEPQNVEQALRRMTQRNTLNMPEACLSIAIACGHNVRKAINAAQLLGQRSSSSELPTADLPASAACHQLLLPSDATDVPEVLELLEQDGEELCRAFQRLYLTSCGESFETLDQCAFAALIVTLNAETGLPKGRVGQPLDRFQSRGAQDGGLPGTNSSPTEIASKVVAQDDTDKLDRTWEDQDERRRADERRTSNAENEVEGELVRGDGHGENRLEASTNEEDGWTPTEEHEDIQDDVAFADGAWNGNAAVFKQKDPLDTVLALNADDAAPNDEVVKEAETAAVEGEAVDFLEVDADRKDEATL